MAMTPPLAGEPLAFPEPESGFRAREPARLSSPVVLSVPHAGLEVAGFEDALAPRMDVRCDADMFVDRLYGVGESTVALDRDRDREPVAPASLPYVVARYSRFVCDMNRHPDDVSPRAVPEHPHPGNADGRGFIWTVTTSGETALRRPLTLAEWEARRQLHAAYYAVIGRALARARAEFGFAILVDGHSMPSVGRQGHTDPARERAAVVPGDRDGTSCSPALSALVGEHFHDAGYSVAFNQPYKGGFITRHHGSPRDGIHAIQIELRRDLYMDETAFAPKPPGFARLAATLAALLSRLDSFQPPPDSSP
jgi:N-formylglutamate deformylase